MSQCVPATSDWPTLAADVLRSGYNAREKGVPPLLDSWAVSLLSDPLNSVVVEGERVFVSGRTRFRETGPVLALDLSTGDALWTHDFGDVSSVGQPSVVDGHVYIQQSKGSGDLPSALFSLSADSGAVEWSTPFSSQWETFWAPTVTQRRVYANGGGYGGLYGFSRGDGSVLFSHKSLEQYDEWAAIAYGEHVYSFVAGNLRAHNRETGGVEATISVPWDWHGWSMNTSPVFSPEGVAYFIAPPTLYAFEVSTKQLLWSHTANFAGMPALAEGLVLAFDSEYLVAFDASTGAQKWFSTGAEGVRFPPVAANGFAYAAGASKTYAVDLRDGKVVWQTPAGGWLAIAGGRLLIAGGDGILRTYTLSDGSD